MAKFARGEELKTGKREATEMRMRDAKIHLQKKKGNYGVWL
jgi:hypothetical protein